MRRKNVVLALPLDEVLLGRELFRHHPHLAARVAVADIAASVAADGGSPVVPRPRFRRVAVLVVDDDQTTQILFAAATPQDHADVALATTPMEAFEHVVSRAVDLLVVSATMRGDGGEPFYRVLWRLKPELKTRCVLVTPPDAAPPSAPRSHPPRIVERPLTQDAIARLVAAFT
jgi:PleD family two-component response regulator